MGDEIKGSPRRRAPPSGLGWPAGRQLPGLCASQGKSEDEHRRDGGSRPTIGRIQGAGAVSF